MSIVILDGKSVAAKATFANTLRDNQIKSGKGALIVNVPKGKEHDPVHQIEKVLVGVPLPKIITDLKALPWKKEVMVIVTSEREKALTEFEEACPGFTKFFGPVQRITVPE